MAKKSLWSKLKSAFKKQSKKSTGLKADSGQTSSSKSAKTSSQSTTRNAYQKQVEAKQSKIQQAFKAERQTTIKQNKAKANATKQELAKKQATLKTKQTNATNNDLKLKQASSNAQAFKTKQNQKKAVDKEWSKAAEKLAKAQGYDSAGQARKNGSSAMTALDIEYGQKKNDKLYSATKGVASGVSAGLTDLSKYVAAPEIREALESAEKNQTAEGKRAETIGSIAGSLVGIGKTAGVSKKIGETAIKGTGKVIGKDLSEDVVVKRLAPMLEKQAAKYSAKKGVEISGEDLAKSVFKEYAEDIGMNIGGWGQAQAISEAIQANKEGESGLKAYAKAQATNALLGIPTNNFIAGKGAINEARIASKVDDVLNPDLNLYLKNGDDVLDTSAEASAKASEKGAKASTKATKKGAGAIAEDVQPTQVTNAEEQVANAVETKESKRLAKLKERDTLNNATENLDNARHYKQGKNGLVDAEEEFAETTARLEELGNKKLLTKVEQAEAKTLNKKLAKMKTPAEWSTSNSEKIAKLEKKVELQGKSKPLSEEARANAQMQTSKGQQAMKEELAKVDDSVDYTRKEPLTYEQAKEQKIIYREHRGVDENGKQLSKTAYSSIFYTNNEAERKALADKIVNGEDFLYEFKGHVENIKKAAERVAKDPQAYISKAETIAKNGTSTRTMTDDSYDMYALLEYVGARLGKSDLSEAEKSALSEISENCQAALKEMSSPSGQTLELRKYFVKISPDSRVRLAVKDMCDLLGKNSKFLKENGITATNKAEKRYQIEEVIQNNEEIDALLKKLYDAQGNENIENAYSEALLSVNKLMKPSVYDLMQEWRYLAMLGNPKTHIRNMVGNKLFGTIRELSNTLAYGIEKSLKASGKLGEDYVMTKGALTGEAIKQARMKEPTDEVAKIALEEWEKFFKATSKENPKYEAALLKNYPASTPIGKFIRGLSNFNSDMLEKADFSSMQKSFREAYYKAYKSNTADGKVLTDSQLARIAESARDEALTSTFREYNSAASLLNKITSSATDPDAGFIQRAIGVGVNAVLPFEKTPANVLKQTFRYSPVGLATGMAKINGAIKSGDSRAIASAIDDIASGTTGTGIVLLGMLFGWNSDAITTTVGDDAAGKFKKQNGIQNYSIRIGDYTFTLDWLTPVISSFFAGAQLANELKNSSDKTGFDLFSDASSFVSKILEPVLETSMLSGLNDAIEATTNNYGDSDDMIAARFVENIAQSYINSFIPTLVGQTSRTLYSADKQIVGDTDKEYNLNSLRSKLGLANVGSNPLGDATDAYGNVKNKKENIGDYLWSAAKNFIIPTNIQKVTLSDDDLELINIYNEAVASGLEPDYIASMFPKQSYVREFVVGKKGSGQTNVTMTNKILSEYNQAKTHAGKSVFEALVDSKYFDGYSKAEKQEIINNAPETLQEAVGQILKMPTFKSLSASEQSKLLSNIINSSGDKKVGAVREQQLTAWTALGKSETNYIFQNDLTERLQNNYKKYKDVISKKDFLWFCEAALTDNGTYTKASMNAALNTRDDLSSEQEAALYNSCKSANLKAYGSSSSGGSGRSSGSGSGSSKSSTQKIKTSAYTTKKFTPKSSSGTTSKGYTLEVKSNLKDSDKATPPTPEKYKFKI